MRNRFFGKYRGEVEDVDDPEERGRLRARVPRALDGELSGWALPCVPFAGDGAGFFAVPTPGTDVWIEFEEGDPSRPIWSGCWWREGQAPAKAGELVLRDVHGNSFAMNSDGIAVEDASGNRIVLSSDGVEITPSADIVVSAGGDVTIEGANVSATARAQAKIEGSAGAEISSSAQTVVSGAIVRIN